MTVNTLAIMKAAIFFEKFPYNYFAGMYEVGLPGYMTDAM
jgi:hypothetical protein